ncbi:MAG: adenylosuccinate lyase, partial [Verrucomicrobiales bacterium]|nr:adenylosuccinate lyase [Verrucomicrobiales bacterium]MDR1304000.1 adenylosuccinate lyase [Verrucomicrobiales bacterium]
ARRAAYETVQRNAMACWRGNGKPFLDFLLADDEVLKLIPAKELKKICSVERHFAHVNSTFKKCGL